MEIWIIGGHHDGLDHYRRSRQWLADKARELGDSPRFVAAEWDQTFAAALLSEREHLRARLLLLWKGAAPAVIEMGVDSLCWEATAHRGLFADEPEVVWLDDKLDERYEFLAKDPKGTIESHKSPPLAALMGDPANASSELQALAHTGAEIAKAWPAWEARMPARRAKETREKTWADRVGAAIGGENKGWGVVIVGAAHATCFDEYTFPSHLKARGINYCRQFLVTPSWFKRTG